MKKIAHNEVIMKELSVEDFNKTILLILARLNDIWKSIDQLQPRYTANNNTLLLSGRNISNLPGTANNANNANRVINQ